MPKAEKSKRTRGKSKLSKDMKEIIHLAFSRAGGVDYLVEQARSEPKAFMGLLGKIVPNEVRLDVAVALNLGQAMIDNQLNLDRLQVIEGNVIATDDTPTHESPAKVLITKDNAK
jgi:hypothetical protein